MSTQAEAADQVVKILLDGSEHAIRIAGSGAKHVAMLLYALLKDQKRTKGKVRLTNMLRSGKELRIFPVKADDLKKFCKEAKKYGVLYCALRQKKDKDGVIDFMARAEDASKISRIFERLQIATVDVASVRSEVVRSKDGPASDKEVLERVAPEKIRRINLWTSCLPLFRTRNSPTPQTLLWRPGATQVGPRLPPGKRRSEILSLNGAPQPPVSPLSERSWRRCAANSKPAARKPNPKEPYTRSIKLPGKSERRRTDESEL